VGFGEILEGEKGEFFKKNMLSKPFHPTLSSVFVLSPPFREL
jgi:hypothetical protein